MYSICQVILFLFLTSVIKYTPIQAYFVPVCSKSGGICSQTVNSYIPGINLENLDYLKNISDFLSKTVTLLRPVRKFCAESLSLILDVIRDVLNLGKINPPPPPPPTLLEHIFRLIGWKEQQQRHNVIHFNLGLMIYLLIIGCTIWMFIWSFYSKSKSDFDWPVKSGCIINSTLRQNVPYRQMCQNCIRKRQR